MSKMTEEEENDGYVMGIEKAIAEGKGWKSPEERQAYIDKVTADDYLPAMFCETQEEFDRSPEAQAFAQLALEGETDEIMMVKKKDEGNKSFALGKQNAAGNVQYYRDAINHYSEALAWGEKIVATDAAPLLRSEDDVDGGEYEGDEEDRPVKFTTVELSKCVGRAVEATSRETTEARTRTMEAKGGERKR